MDAQRRTKRITFIGGPGSGKSTTAADLFVQLKKLGKNVEMIQEWIRRDIMRNGPMGSVFEQYRTLMYHRTEEEHFPPNVEYLIHDGNTLLNYFYAAIYADKSNPKDRLVIQDMHGALLDDLYSQKYDLIYFLPRAATAISQTQFDDGTRVQTPAEVDVLEQYMTLLFTKIHNLDNIKVLDCPLYLRNEILIADILGPEAVNQWISLMHGESNDSNIPNSVQKDLHGSNPVVDDPGRINIRYPK